MPSAGRIATRSTKAPSSSGETLLASSAIGPSFTDTSVTDDTTYFYEVTAVNSAGASDFSSETSATPQANSGSATPVDLSSSFNRVGIVSDASTFGGGLDEDGNALSPNELDASVTWNYQTFALGARNRFVLPMIHADSTPPPEPPLTNRFLSST